ncbi:MAG: HAMP domain-containing histidine kinase [Clostridia bacterium]|nr:HAMP domain-containing histidine kinase [Clostridia bacterium]
MATKSTKSKYPLILKALCLVLAVLCFLGTSCCALYGVMAVRFLPTTDLPLSGATASFYDSDLFTQMLCGDIDHISNVLIAPQKEKQLETYRKQRDALIDREAKRYLAEKAAIIANEVYFVATNYDQIDEEDYYYDAYMRDFGTTTTTAVPTTTVPTTAVQADQSKAETRVGTTAPAPETETTARNTDPTALPKVTIDERAPYNVRYCQSLCNSVSGLDWLNYESLVRDVAFSEAEFTPSFDDLGNRNTYNYFYPETQMREQLAGEYDELLRDAESALSVRYDENELNRLRNLKYYAESEDGTVITNMTAAEQNEKSVAAHQRYILCKGEQITCELQNAQGEEVILLRINDSICPLKANLRLYLENTFTPGDRYASVQGAFDRLFVQTAPKTVLAVGIACALGTLFFFVTLLCLCGHKSGVEGITLSFIDRVPTDVHLLVSALLILGCLGIFMRTADLFDSSLWDTEPIDYISEYYLRIGLIFALILSSLAGAFLVFLEWLTSTVRIKKAGRSFFRGFVIWKLFRFFWRGIRFCARKIVVFIRFLFDRPKKLRSLPFFVCAVYLAAVLLSVLFADAIDEPALIYLGVPIVTILLTLVAVWFLRMLDKIAEAAETRTDLPESVTCKMPRALRQLAENQSVTNRELDKAVAEAVRNERTKAELITNVSHDLKTPLTSVISYVDLLKKCDITDEKALEYLDVLDEKSAKLKRLIEDLIEASKIGTGNVTLRCVPLNLAELATQAVSEAAPDFEANDLELKFTPPEKAPILFADGAKTYRILDNLLSNARKYSAPHSRVYAKVETDDRFGIFEIKNISREPLDIDPQELMERFVRGDRSRSDGGNGLGLSIAQQLCTLQGGKLEVQIDGDLFKATVYLPLQTNAPQTEV